MLIFAKFWQFGELVQILVLRSNGSDHIPQWTHSFDEMSSECGGCLTNGRISSDRQILDSNSGVNLPSASFHMAIYKCLASQCCATTSCRLAARDCRWRRPSWWSDYFQYFYSMLNAKQVQYNWGAMYKWRQPNFRDFWPPLPLSEFIV